MTMTSDLAAQRTARARAFIKQERVKWQRSWADLTYEYDRELPAQPEKANDDANTENNLPGNLVPRPPVHG